MNSKNHIQKLLQLKRYEVPPSDFYENFLIEFRRRQKLELLRRTVKPSWKQTLLALLLASLRMPRLGYIVIAIIGILVSIAFWFPFLGRTPKHSVTNFFFHLKGSDFYSFHLPTVKIPKQQTVGTLPSHFEEP